MPGHMASLGVPNAWKILYSWSISCTPIPAVAHSNTGLKVGYGSGGPRLAGQSAAEPYQRCRITKSVEGTARPGGLAQRVNLLRGQQSSNLRF
eukprot:1159085-Pelagomonas_calceolata.AAC.6